ncbi:hypothetical protein A5N15_06825 [Rothia kristinae]|uniref:Uncharacterized protein n=1 Tax=Rothia kristinae TaxID=37923 RepID=A0A657IUA1_9MICC|nr:hypothetical protein A5N15_06825 [Rothia kristinae]
MGPLPLHLGQQLRDLLGLGDEPGRTQQLPDAALAGPARSASIASATSFRYRKPRTSSTSSPSTGMRE